MIYCVDDDQSIQKIVVYTLNSMGFEAEGFYDSVSLYKAIDQRLPSLIILDIMLPNEDGIAILSSLRKNKKTRDIPIIMATANGKEYDKIEALDLGADDYLVKPFDLEELVARIKSITQRIPKNKLFKKNNISIDFQAKKVKYIKNNKNNYDKEISLTIKEFTLLELLLQNQGIALSRTEIIEEIR